jgi:hypothetical protein
MTSQSTSPSDSLDEVIEVKDLGICGLDTKMRCIHLTVRDHCVMLKPPCKHKKVMFIRRDDLLKYIAIRLTN